MQGAPAAGWSDALRLFQRQRRFPWTLGLLFLIVPFYMVIGWEYAPGSDLHAPATALDAMLPLVPAASVIYGSLFLAALLPAFVVHEPQLFERVIAAYILAWLVSFAFFLAYPTVCPRPARVEGQGFAEWVLRIVYGSDHRYNCFPSLHVAQVFIAALACRVVNRRLGNVLLAWAALVGVSTVLTKQHYVADAVVGMLLGVAALAWALRSYPAGTVPADERALAPRLALAAFAVYGVFVAVLGAAFLAG